MLKFAHIALGTALFLAAPTAHAQAPLPSAPTSGAPATGTSSNSLRAIGAPGVLRDAGLWLFNDSLFVSPGTNIGAAGAPVFLGNLRRDKKEKLPLFRPAGTPLKWSTLPLPSLRDMSAAGFNFGALQTTLTTQIANAKTQGLTYVGWSLPVGEGDTELNKSGSSFVVQKLRGILDAVDPSGALILEVDAAPNPQRSLFDVDAAAALCDAVVLKVGFNDPHDVWPLKMIRRVVEEQTSYDLPVFVTFNGAAATQAEFDACSLEYYMGGATGFITSETAAWAPAIGRNPGLFDGAVTLEDAAILPSPNPKTLQFFDALRASERIPLVGRLLEGGGAESLFVVIDDKTTIATLDSIDRAARNGAAVYMEGVPDLKNSTLLRRIEDMTSTRVEVLPAPVSESINPSDPWMFGDTRNHEFDVTQRVKWTIKTSLAGQSKIRRGEESTAPFSAATLAHDNNGFLVAPLGKGRILWLAHTPNNPDATSRRAFYSAIAGNLQAAMIKWTFNTVEDEVRVGSKIHAAMRASKTGTPIVALWNEAATEANVNLVIRGGLPLTYDLKTEQELQSTVRGYSSLLPVKIPAGGYVWLTFGKTKKDFDKERLTKRVKPRVIEDKKKR